ncbi:MAG: N-acetylmuramoyl-L-alanine amidase, partial [Candidatus Aminicenantes bacterium]
MSKITRFLMVTIIVVICIYTLFPDNKLCFIRKCFTFEEPKGLKYPDNVYIYIDPGHGARGTLPSAGTSSRDFNNPPDSQVQNLPNIDEKDVVLDIAIRVKNYLHQKGFKNVDLTRTANIRQDLHIKVDKIKEYFNNSYFDYKKKCVDNTCCDGFTGLFISIHCNGGPSKKSGAEAYHQEMGAGLAASVLDHLGKVMGKHLPSAKYKDLMVLREGVDPFAKVRISVKGTLAELGYIRNRKDYMKVVNNKDDIVKAIAKGLINNALWQSTKNTINLCRKPDNPDDNYSDADGQNPEYMVDTESKVLLPFEFFNHDTLSMLNKTIGPPAVYARETTADMVKKHPVMILPGGSLAGKENDSTLKQVLKQYVENNGTLIVFGQQFGDHLDQLNLFPGGESISSYGFREDQSCLKNSAYFSDMHPILSSSTTGIVDVGVDGYFTVNSSSNAKVLLRRKINDEPVLLYYKYGAGTIFLTSLFSDYAYPRSM